MCAGQPDGRAAADVHDMDLGVSVQPRVRFGSHVARERDPAPIRRPVQVAQPPPGREVAPAAAVRLHDADVPLADVGAGNPIPGGAPVDLELPEARRTREPPWVAPSAFMTQMSRFLSRSAVYAILRPSGDQVGDSTSPPLAAWRTRSLPAASMTQRTLPCAKLASAGLRPSGDHASPRACEATPPRLMARTPFPSASMTKMPSERVTAISPDPFADRVPPARRPRRRSSPAR